MEHDIKVKVQTNDVISIRQGLNNSKVRVFFAKNTDKSTRAIMITIIVTFANQIFLQVIWL